MNLLEFENKQFPGLWNEETIKELKEHKPTQRKDPGKIEFGWENEEPLGYECYCGRYLADSVLW